MQHSIAEVQRPINELHDKFVAYIAVPSRHRRAGRSDKILKYGFGLKSKDSQIQMVGIIFDEEY